MIGVPSHHHANESRSPTSMRALDPKWSNRKIIHRSLTVLSPSPCSHGETYRLAEPLVTSPVANPLTL
jgi:hypothetical protein